jgi:hypothetical protein
MYALTKLLSSNLCNIGVRKLGRIQNWKGMVLDMAGEGGRKRSISAALWNSQDENKSPGAGPGLTDGFQSSRLPGSNRPLPTASANS